MIVAIDGCPVCNEDFADAEIKSATHPSLQLFAAYHSLNPKYLTAQTRPISITKRPKILVTYFHLPLASISNHVAYLHTRVSRGSPCFI
jgi:hypothetical protein